MKLFLLVFMVITTHTVSMATDLVDNTLVESNKIKTSSIDVEENTKDFKLDLLISHHNINTVLQVKKSIFSLSLAYSDIYLKAPFKPPRT